MLGDGVRSLRCRVSDGDKMLLKHFDNDWETYDALSATGPAPVGWVGWEQMRSKQSSTNRRCSR